MSAHELIFGATGAKTSVTVTWPTNGRPRASPASVGVDKESLERFDADLARGKYMLVAPGVPWRELGLRGACWSSSVAEPEPQRGLQTRG